MTVASVTSRYPKAFDILERAQRAYPGGEALCRERFDEELDEILGAIGLIPSGDPSTEFFLELTNPHVRRNRQAKVNLDDVFLDTPIKPHLPPRRRGRPRKADYVAYSDRFIRKNLTTLTTILSRVARIKRPLHSSYCRGAVRALLNEAVRRHCPELLKRKGVRRVDDAIHQLRKKTVPSYRSSANSRSDSRGLDPGIRIARGWC